MPTVQTEVDGETVDVEVTSDDLPDDQVLMSKSTLDDEYVDADYHEKEIDRVKNRFDSDMRSDVRKELKEDESFRKEVAAEFDLDEEQRKEIVQQVEENKVKPAEEEAEGWRYRFKRERALSELENREDVAPKALASIGNAEPLAMQALSDRLMIQGDGPEDAKVVMTDDEGNPLPGEDGGYASVSEGLDHLKDDESYEPLFSKEQPSKGSGFNSSGTPSSSADGWEDMSSGEVMDYVKEHGHHPRMDAE